MSCAKKDLRSDPRVLFFNKKPGSLLYRRAKIAYSIIIMELIDKAVKNK